MNLRLSELLTCNFNDVQHFLNADKKVTIEKVVYITEAASEHI